MRAAERENVWHAQWQEPSAKPVAQQPRAWTKAECKESISMQGKYVDAGKERIAKASGRCKGDVIVSAARQEYITVSEFQGKGKSL